VALCISVRSSFSLAPVISCIPDIIISDADDNTATDDKNFFVFSQALNLDELVRDDDTASNTLRWSFVDSTGDDIQINGKDELADPTPDNIKDPSGSNIRSVSKYATFRNKTWSPASGSTPYANPPASSMTSTLELYVSDGTGISSQPIIVKTVNTSGDPTGKQHDQKIPQSTRSYTFNSTAEGWRWFDMSPGFPGPAGPNIQSGGRLRMVELVTQTQPIVYGRWESSYDPATALRAKWGCIMRARYKMYSTVDGMNCPGMRFLAWWTHVMNAGGTAGWIQDWVNQDFADEYEMDYHTTNISGIFVPGREPGTAGQTYTFLYYPQQIDTLTTGIVWISADLLDMDTFNNDAGEISIDQVDVDGIPCPEVGTGTRVNQFSSSSFSTWRRNSGVVDASLATTAGITLTLGAQIVINVP